MKFYEFGENVAPVILLLPGTCCHWKLNEELLVLYPEQWAEKVKEVCL